eukprot:Skav236553  [mRNA]  locus=scaffold1066:137574:138197:- [translate_table: standard]
MARASALSKALVAAGALMALRLLSGEAFVTPKQRNEAAAALAAAMVAASSAPAMAEVPQFSVFGFGNGQSDAYSQNDNPINPYSQFSDVGSGAETVYKARNEVEVERRGKALKAALVRFENTPEYIQTKQAQALKANLLEAGGSLKQDLYYFSGEEGSKAYEKARAFAQKVGTLGVDGGNKQWARAAEDYTAASKILAEWKDLSGFK